MNGDVDGVRCQLISDCEKARWLKEWRGKDIDAMVGKCLLPSLTRYSSAVLKNKPRYLRYCARVKRKYKYRGGNQGRVCLRAIRVCSGWRCTPN